MTIKHRQGYTPMKERMAEERKTALLWLFVASRGLLSDFTDFYKLHHSQTMEEINREFIDLLNSETDGK